MTAITQNMRIIYRKDDGGVAIVTPIPNPDFTLEEIIEKTVPAGVPHRVIDVSELPEETKYRNAWVWED